MVVGCGSVPRQPYVWNERALLLEAHASAAVMASRLPMGSLVWSPADDPIRLCACAP